MSRLSQYNRGSQSIHFQVLCRVSCDIFVASIVQAYSYQAWSSEHVSTPINILLGVLDRFVQTGNEKLFTVRILEAINMQNAKQQKETFHDADWTRTSKCEAPMNLLLCPLAVEESNALGYFMDISLYHSGTASWYTLVLIWGDDIEDARDSFSRLGVHCRCSSVCRWVLFWLNSIILMSLQYT